LANTKQQRKRVKITERQRTENLRYKSRIKTMFKTLTVAAQEDKERAAALGIELMSLIDKAASRGVIHENNAARKKSRVASIIELAHEIADQRWILVEHVGNSAVAPLLQKVFDFLGHGHPFYHICSFAYMRVCGSIQTCQPAQTDMPAIDG